MFIKGLEIERISPRYPIYIHAQNSKYLAMKATTNLRKKYSHVYISSHRFRDGMCVISRRTVYTYLIGNIKHYILCGYIFLNVEVRV